MQEGKKSKKIHQHQQTYTQHSHAQNHQPMSKDDYHTADDENSGKNYDNYDDDHSKPYSGTRGMARGGGHAGSDFPPRFRGRGGSVMRNNQSKLTAG